jgi:hypothetical protein
MRSLQQQLEFAPATKRNDRLFWVAATMFEIVAEGKLSRDVAIHLLMQGAKINGLRADDGEARCMATIASAEQTVERKLRRIADGQ